MTEKTDAEIKISAGKIAFQRNHPFFSYLSFFLKPIEVKSKKKWEEGGLGMGVDVNGNLIYNPDFVNKLSKDEMTGILAHEILHLAYLHLTRGRNLNKKLLNISQDIVVNEVLKDNNFILPDGVIWSDNNREVIVFNKVVQKCNTKTAEEIYWELIDNIKEELKGAKGKGKKDNSKGEEIEIDADELGDYEIEGSNNEGKGKVRNFDRHIQGKGKDGKELDKEERDKIEKDWIEKIQEAYIGSKIAGKEPLGIDRLVGRLHESRINWKQLLSRYIQSCLPSDFTYSKPNKKSISSGFYMPDVEKERIEIAVGIDVSGSIGNEELQDFLSEVVGIARAFRERIKMTLFTHETKIVNEWVIENGNVQKILALNIKGGGGTSFITPYKEFIEKHKDIKLMVWLTDGCGDKIEKKDLKCNIIWILSKNGSDELIKDIGKVIELK